MGVKYDEIEGWVASSSVRHPVTRLPRSLRRKGFKSEAEARRAEKEMYHEIQSGFQETVVPTWNALLDRYLIELNNCELGEKTKHSYQCALNAHTRSLWGAKKIDAITTQEIKDLIRKRLEDRTDYTKKYVLKCIRGVFRYAVENNFLARNPVPEMKFRIGDKIKQHLTEPQVRLLLQKAHEYNHDWYYHWALALYTGMRNGELYALIWDRVDFDNGTIKVDCSWNSRDGFKDTKSGDDRVISIGQSLLPILKELKLKTSDTGYVLPRFTEWDKGEQARELRRFLIGLGLPQIRFHDLRATWATMLLSKGVEPIKVMTMGGWKNLKTMQIYIRKAGVDIKGATDCLNLHTPSEKVGQLLNFSLS